MGGGGGKGGGEREVERRRTGWGRESEGRRAYIKVGLLEPGISVLQANGGECTNSDFGDSSMGPRRRMKILALLLGACASVVTGRK